MYMYIVLYCCFCGAHSLTFVSHFVLLFFFPFAFTQSLSLSFFYSFISFIFFLECYLLDDAYLHPYIHTQKEKKKYGATGYRISGFVQYPVMNLFRCGNKVQNSTMPLTYSHVHIYKKQRVRSFNSVIFCSIFSFFFALNYIILRTIEAKSVKPIRIGFQSIMVSNRLLEAWDPKNDWLQKPLSVINFDTEK